MKYLNVSQLLNQGGAIKLLGATQLTHHCEKQIIDPKILIGRIFGNYKINEFLCSGGFSHVYRASRCDDQFQKDVAIKILSNLSFNHEIDKRFLEECQILADLEHPNIAGIIDSGISPDNIRYLIMELIDGEPIDQYCENNQLSTLDKIKLFIQVADVISFAHKKLIIHQDIKPSNILVNKEGIVKLLDFNISTVIISNTTSVDTDNTVETETPITPLYASPEQFQTNPITVESDVYQLGLLLLLIISGGLGEREKADSFSTLTNIVLNHPPPICSEILDKNENNISRYLPFGNNHFRDNKLYTIADIDAIIGKALNIDPARRYSSVDHLVADLRRFIQFRPISIYKHKRKYSLYLFLKRNRYRVFWTNVFMIFTIAFSAKYIADINTERKSAIRESNTSKLVIENMESLFRETSPRHSGLTNHSLLNILVKEAEGIKNLLSVNKNAYAKLAIIFSDSLIDHSKYTAAHNLLAPIVNNDSDFSQELWIKAVLLNTRIVFRERKHDKNIENISIALKKYQEYKLNNTALLSNLYNRLAVNYIYIDEYTKAETAFIKSLALIDTIDNKNSRDKGKIMYNYALLLKHVNRYSESIHFLEKTRSLYIDTFGEDYPVLSKIYSTLAQNQLSTKKIEAAYNNIQKSNRINKLYWPSEKVNIIINNRILSAILIEKGQYELAIKRLLDTKNLLLDDFFGDPSDHLISVNRLLAISYSKMNNKNDYCMILHEAISNYKNNNNHHNYERNMYNEFLSMNKQCQ